MLTPELDDILRRCKEALQDLYGDRFAGLLLYGSIARGDYNPESDIDLLVLLKGQVDPVAEIAPLVDATQQLQLDCDRMISLQAASVDEYQAGDWSFLRTVRQEARLL